MTARVHYAWVVAAVTFLSLVLASRFRSVTGTRLPYSNLSERIARL